MKFKVRQAKLSDLEDIYELAKQFTLLNLPAKKFSLEKIIATSEESFRSKLPKDKSRYLFVVEDIENKKIVATSLIIAKHGTEKEPHYSFKVLSKEHFSKDIGIGFKHNILRFHENKDGPSEIGGLLLDVSYRNRPEKLGKLISLIRFMYIKMKPEQFENEILCELSPPLTPEGRSEFWEALGRNFTGLPYQEADQISQNHKEFITSLFPKEDIYVCLLNPKARVDTGRIAEQTAPAKYMLESIGFRYLNEVDPFDGGPHYGAKTEDIKVYKETYPAIISFNEEAKYQKSAMIAAETDEGFIGGLVTYNQEGDKVSIPAIHKKSLGLSEGQKVYIYPL